MAQQGGEMATLMILMIDGIVDIVYIFHCSIMMVLLFATQKMHAHVHTSRVHIF